MEERKRLRQQNIRDLAPARHGPGVARWALNMTALEHDFLVAANHELEQEDSRLQSIAWMRFIESRESDPFKVGTKV
jgi:hypothetical protein